MYTKKIKKIYQSRSLPGAWLRWLIPLTAFLLVVPFPGCSSNTKKKTTPEVVKKVEPKKKKDPRSYFKFKKNGEVKTRSGKAEKTFNFPDLKVGFIFVAPQLDVLPVLAIEIHEFDKIPLYFDFGISTHLVYFAVGYNIIPIFEVGIFLYGGYNFIDRDKEFFGKKFHGVSFGIGITVIKF